MASDRHAWISRPSGPARLADESDAAPGAAIALGPAEATPEQVRHAITGLSRIVRAGGVVAAGAGVDLGAGFRSARLAGARGDQRDAVLAALKVLGIEGAGRLGDRAGFLVALFGPAVTKRVGAAAAQAMAEGRWAALHLASAASDTLGPEQLERVLALTAPDGADLIAGGLPSALAVHLRQVLEPINGPRRLELIVDLWARVSERHAAMARRERLLANQGRQGRVDDLRKRRAHYQDEMVLWQLRANLADENPSLADAARWVPTDHYWYGLLNRMLQDALAATALLRTAVAVSDHGLEDGLARSRALIRAVGSEFSETATAHAKRKVPGLTGLPARPGSHVRDIHLRLEDDGPRDARFWAYLRQRLARARDYALVVIESVEELLGTSSEIPEQVMRNWAEADLTNWREEVGYSPVRPPTTWGEAPPWPRGLPGRADSLAQRLEGQPDPVGAGAEVLGDLLWYAELIDALAQLHGHDAAAVTPGLGPEWLNHDPPMAPPEPLTPRLDSITLAVSGAAQLVALGATPPRRARTWAEFVEGLRAGTQIAEALSGEFSVPARLAAVDGEIVPGTGARFRLAQTARTLAEWSDYMGNCIAGPHYLESALKGRCGLAALYDKSDRILVNAELRPARPATRGWIVTEIAARFNDTPDETLEKRFRRWVATIPGVGEADDTDLPSPDEPLPGRPGRRRASRRLLEDAGPALGRLAGRAWAEQVTSEVRRTLASLAERSPDAAALTRLRRLGPAQLKSTCRDRMSEGALDLAELWTMTGIRPLDTAVEALDPALRDRFDRLTLLSGDTPLPGSLRRLVRLPAVAPSYSLGLVGRRVRTAIGELACDDDPAVARAVTRRATVPMLCALVVTVTCRAPEIHLIPVAPPRTVTVPGFPTTGLDDENGPWQRAFPAARELGADTTVFWDRIAEHGLRVPAAWLGTGGWTALWSRAHHPRRAASR